MILGQAGELHWKACQPWRRTGETLLGRLAQPFGTPFDMPPHRWRVSPDVLQALYNASPPPIGPNPKNGDDGTIRLYGWPIEKDAAAPPGTLLLEPVAPLGPPEPWIERREP